MSDPPVLRQAGPLAAIMKQFVIIVTLLIFSINYSSAQSSQMIDSLLLPLYKVENSKDISKALQAKQIISYGSNLLLLLSTYFTDTTQTNIKSDCQNIYLTKGEVAIILADRIEIMPYALLTGIQNDILEFCKDNPNLVEYYLTAIRRNNIKLFKQKYIDWLISKNRKEWPPYLNNTEKAH